MRLTLLNVINHFLLFFVSHNLNYWIYFDCLPLLDSVWQDKTSSSPCRNGAEEAPSVCRLCGVYPEGKTLAAPVSDNILAFLHQRVTSYIERCFLNNRITWHWREGNELQDHSLYVMWKYGLWLWDIMMGPEAHYFLTQLYVKYVFLWSWNLLMVKVFCCF